MIETVRCVRLKKQLSIHYVTEHGKPDSNTPIDEIKVWFALTIKNRQMKETVEHRVDIVAAPHMRGTFIYNPSRACLRLFNLFHADCLSRKPLLTDPLQRQAAFI